MITAFGKMANVYLLNMRGTKWEIQGINAKFEMTELLSFRKVSLWTKKGAFKDKK